MTFQEILASCIEALEDEKSIEFCLSAYPQHADRLEPLLRIVAHLRSLSRTQVSSGAPLVMHEFRAILASCIEALAGGKSIQFCLSTYPQHAERLEPLLQIVAHLHSQQMPQRQPLARVHGRELVAQANLKRTGQWVPTPTPSPIFQSAGFNSLFARFQQQTTVPVTQQARQSYWPNMVMTATAACLLLVASLMLQSTVSSLPGDTLYPVKRSGEQVAGLAMQAFGEPAAWQMDQVARRIDEIEILEESGRFVDPALVAEVKEEAEEVQEVIAALPPTERETAQDKWINILENHREDAEDDSAVVAVVAEPIATAHSVIAQADLLEPDPQMTPQVQVAMIPAATWIPPDPSIQTDGSLPVPTQTQQRPSTAPVGEPATSAATAPSATQPSRRATVTPQSQGANTSSRSASATATTRSMEPMLGLGPDGSIGAAKVSPTPVNTRVSTRTPQPTASLTPTKIITPTKTVMPTSGPSIVGTATNTPVATSTFTPLLLATATRPAASSPVLLPTVTNTPLPTAMPTSTPTAMASATTAPVLIPTVTPTSTSLPTVTPEPTVIEFIEATNTPLPTATPTQVSTDTPQPTATAISEPTAMPQPTATWTLEPTSTQMPTATAMPAPTFTPLPVATATSAPTSAPTWTPLPPATATSAPTWTPLPPATATSAPTWTPLPPATVTPAPTFTPLPAATATSAPTWTPLPTATATPAPTWTPLPTATATQGPTFSPLPTETPRSGEPEVPDALPEVETPTSEPTSEPTFTPTATWTPLPTSTPLPTVVPVLSPTATPTTKPAFTPLPTDTSLS